jgi:hypothetical protein
MLPNPSELVLTVNGRTYTGTANQVIQVQSADASVLSANGWTVAQIATVNNEVPSGTKNNSNTTFTLANAFVTGSLNLQKNGQSLLLTNDWTVAADGLTLTLVVAPLSTDNLTATYQY